MAVTNKINMDPEEMSAKASQFDSQNEEFVRVVTDMGNLVNALTSEWAGTSSQAFFDQFESLRPGFEQTSQLIQDIASQLREVSDAMMNMDAEIASKINNM